MLRDVVRGLNCVFISTVPVPPHCIFNFVTIAYVAYDFVDDIFTLTLVVLMPVFFVLIVGGIRVCVALCVLGNIAALTAL